jgi:pimeloyl-ACP methyl ester carboxylesterase
MTSHFLYVAWLINAGYRVVTFDYRGYGSSTGKPGRRELHEDAIKIVRWTSQTFGEPLVVVGQSLGGAVALPALVEANVPVKLVLLDSTFGSYRLVARKKLHAIWLTWAFQYPMSWLISDDYSPEEYLDRYALPTIVMHGDADGVVPYELGERLYAKIQSADKEFWRIPKGRHTAAFAMTEDTYRNKFLATLDRIMH